MAMGVLFLSAFSFAIVVLSMAAVTAAASVSSSLHSALHDWAVSESLWGRAALRMANASHDTESGWQLFLDFGFSLLNLTLAAFLFWLRPRDRTAPLLALGLVGTAAVFNLQAHLVYETVDPNFFEALSHDGFTVATALAYVFALLIFPDGRPVPRWRAPVLVVAYGGLAVATALIALRNPESRTASLVMVFGVVAPIAGVLAQGYRHQRPLHAIERQQSRLLFWALSPALAVSLVALATGLQSGGNELEGRELLDLPVTLFRVFQPVFLLIPAALLVGIFRFRLWDVDRLISRALLYTVLAGFVSAVYVGVVVGLGTLIGGASSETGNVPLAIAATFLVAVAFDPVKSRLQRLVNRLVLGARATPYEVLSSFAERMGESLPNDELLARMARVLAEGTGALRADVWLKVGDELRPAAAWSTAEVPAPNPHRISGDDLLPAAAEVSRLAPVRHQGELYGALSVTVAPGEELSLTEEKLLHDLAGQAGLVLRNLRLTSELLQRLEELKGSRQRLVSAQDEERRRLERNLHDGAQQQLVALKVHLSLAEGIATRLGDGGRPLVELLGQVKEQAGEALEELRSLARGIYPPLLAAEGLPSALTSQARKSSLRVEIHADGIGRYPQDIEAAVYFCTLEALQNAAKYAGDCRVDIELAANDGALEFVVRDDGAGYDADSVTPGAGLTNMADRIEALGGTFAVHSTPGAGTEVRGRMPVEQAAAVGS